jgi:hypothetical protein
MQNYRLSWPVFSEAPAFTLRRYAGKISYPASFAEQAWRSAKMLLFLELCCAQPGAKILSSNRWLQYHRRALQDKSSAEGGADILVFVKAEADS